MNNQNSGGSYIEKNTNAYYIRTEGLVKSIADIENIPVATHNGVPVLVKDVGKVQFGSPKRFGAMTMDGERRGSRRYHFDAQRGQFIGSHSKRS